MGRQEDGVKCWHRVDLWSIWLCALGGLLIAISTFLPRWRADEVGTSGIEALWWTPSFPGKTYGLMSVQGKVTQSWSVVVEQTCQYRKYGQLLGSAQAMVQLVKNFDWDLSSCKGSEQCSAGFINSIQVRCTEYEKMWQMSTCVMVFNFIAVMMVSVSTMLSLLAERRRTGGLSFAMYVLAGFASLVLNIAWAVMTDGSFSRIMDTAWYPYPMLGIGYMLHLYGALMLLVSGGVYGYLVIPEVWAYDPEEEKLNDRKRKLAKMQQQAVKQQMQLHQNAMPTMPEPLPYGDGMYPQQHPQQYQQQPQHYQQQQLQQPQYGGQGLAPPAGYPAGGYGGGPPTQMQGGFNAPYGMPSPAPTNYGQAYPQPPQGFPPYGAPAGPPQYMAGGAPMQ